MKDLREREKAIEVLRNAAWLGTDADREQIEQAIEILANPDLPETHDKHTKTHSCDCISRQAAIDAIKTWGLIDGLAEGQAIEILADEEKLPSAQPDMSEYSDKLWKAAYERGKAEAQQRWIPCSEQLPDEFGEYLVTKKAIGWNCEEYNSNDIAYFDNEGFHKADKVLAWMPLPEPYREEGD